MGAIQVIMFSKMPAGEEGLNNYLRKCKDIEFNIIKQGFKDKAIAEMMFADIKTIESHKSHILHKFNLKDVKEFMLMAALEILNAGIVLLSIFPILACTY